MSEHDEQTEANWPLWRAALNTIRRRSDYGYGMKIETPELEKLLACKRDTPEFAFGMIDIRQAIESDHGYYLGSQTITEDETGLRKEVWQIPNAAQHEDVAKSFEARMRRFAKRSLLIRDKTLNNDKANLSEEERANMDKAFGIAQTRLVLLRREKGVADFVRKNSPKLIETNSKDAESA